MLLPLGSQLSGTDVSLELLGDRREHLGHSQEKSLPEGNSQQTDRQHSHNVANA